MNGILKVTPDDIHRLDDKQLTDLLIRLLTLEAKKFSVPTSSISGSLEIKAADGGEDASIKWSGGIEETNWIPNRYTLFQCKATEISRAGCKNEILDGNELKSRVKDVFDSNGTYILFSTQSCNSEMKVRRESGFRDGIHETGAPYWNTASIKIYGADEISNWVNEYLPLIVQVGSWLGRHFPNSISTWEDWAKYSGNEVDYVSDATLDSHISQLRDYFTDEKKVARIVGLSGLGKTRLALEVFRPPENPEDIESQTTTNLVVYLDAADSSDGLQGTIKQWRENDLKGIVVIDNCELELHRRLVREIEHPNNRLSLLTLDYNPEPNDRNHVFIKLERASDTVIKGIIKQSYPSLQEPYIQKITEFAEGFPKIAVMLAEACLNEVQDLGHLNDNDLRDKLLWGRRTPNDEARDVISACSLFTHIGFTDDMIHQCDFIAENVCEISKDRFYKHATDFVKQGVLDKRNRFVRVVPVPLAVGLATDWWIGCHPEKAKRLITSAMPDNMAEAMCDQMTKLQSVHKAQQLTKELCGETAPFGQAEVLNSNKGSRLFRSLVEVNPLDTALTLERVFGDWNKEQLLQIKVGRRNLVWALEKLCFWNDTFPIAARVLLSFAVAENETWGNNSRNMFFQLFHYLLSGTQAHPNLRLQIIDEALTSEDIDYKIIAVEALGHALHTQHFSRDAGVVTQGSRVPQEDWKPKIWQEVFDYWTNCFERLNPLAKVDDELGALARKQITSNMRGLVGYGRIEDFDSALQSICVDNHIFWPEAYKEVKNTLYFDGCKLPPEGRAKLKEWLGILEPKSFEQRWELMVTNPPMEFETEEGESRIDASYKLVNAFAEDCANDSQELFANLKVAFNGEQRKGYAFGHAFGQYYSQHEDFVQKALDTLKKIPPERADPSVLCGFVHAVQHDSYHIIENMFDSIIKDDTLSIYILNLTCSIEPTKKDLDRIVELVKLGNYSPNDLRSFAQGSILKHFSAEHVISFCEDILNFGIEGIFPALEVLFMYTFQEEEKFNSCYSEFQRILEMPGILLKINSASIMDIHYFNESVSRLLDSEEQNDEFAINISKEIIRMLSPDNFSVSLVSDLDPIIRILLTKYRDIVWSIFEDALLSDDQNYYLSMIFAPENNAKYSSDGVLSVLDGDFLIKWCNEHLENAPPIVAKLIPLFIEENGSCSFSPVAESFIYTFGDRTDVQSSLYSNMWCISSVGSLVPHYEKQIEAIKKLETSLNPKLSRWCSQMIHTLYERIQYEKGREEERELGIF